MRLRRCPEPTPQLSVTEILPGVGLAMDATLILEVNQVNATLPSPRCRVPDADPVCPLSSAFLHQAQFVIYSWIVGGILFPLGIFIGDCRSSFFRTKLHANQASRF